jgi:hypothetical protein
LQSYLTSYQGGGGGGREQKLANDKYDEAVEVSQSMDQHATPPPKNTRGGGGDDKASKQTDSTKSNSILNKPFDEALEISQSGSEESIDTQSGRGHRGKAAEQIDIKAPTPQGSFSQQSAGAQMRQVPLQCFY